VAAVGHRRSIIVLGVLIGALATTITITILTIALPPIADDLGASVTDTAWVLLAPIVVSALVSPSSGRIADRVGRKRMWMVGFTIAGAGILASALAPSLAVLIVARIVTGVGTAFALPAGLAIAVAEYPPSQRGLPLGWWTSTTALSPAAGVLLGGVAVEHLSWRWLFWGQLPLIAAALLWGALVFREQRDPRPGKFDLAGALLGGAAVFGVLIAINRGTAWGWTSAPILGCMAMAVVCAPAFIAVERRAEMPVFPTHLLGDTQVRLAVLARVFIHAAYMGSFVVLPVALMEIGMWTPAAVALGLSPRPIALGLSGPVAGILTTRRDPALITLTGAMLLTAGVSYLVFMTPNGPYLALCAALVAMGIGLGLAGTSSGAIVTSRTDEADLGMVSGFLGVVGAVSNSMGMAVLLSIVTIAGGEKALSAFHWAFGVGAALAACAALSALTLVVAERRDRNRAAQAVRSIHSGA
jgi:MFS family permease